MSITLDQVLALAPDPASAAAGRKLGSPKTWKGLGRDDRAAWGECQGSALYKTKVDLTDFTANCSCPSRKFPCKHGIGLLVLHAQGAVPAGAQPDWVAEWIGKRDEKVAKKEAKAAAPVDPEAAGKAAAAAAKRVEKRLDRVGDGLDGLDAWTNDLVREGLAALESKAPSYYEQQAARLVDAQARGLAGRVRRIGDLVGAGEDWPARVLGELGHLAMLTHTFRRVDALDPALASTVRQLVGFDVEKEAVIAGGDLPRDTWAIVGVAVEDDEQVRSQRAWLVGANTGRMGLILQFAPGKQPFPVTLLAGSSFEGTLAFWPGAAPQRALVHERGLAGPWPGRLPGHATIASALDAVAGVLAEQPWASSFGMVLHDVVPALQGADWHAIDRSGDGLPLSGIGCWRLLAVSGGHPVDLYCEWDGRQLRALGCSADGVYVPAGGR